MTVLITNEAALTGFAQAIYGPLESEDERLVGFLSTYSDPLALSQLLDQLGSPQKRFVVVMSFGLDGQDPLRAKIISHSLAITRDTVRRELAASLRIFRRCDALRRQPA
jgi:DNA-directed RNA polymerase sigma subunit (sigma70/sigma32)